MGLAPTLKIPYSALFVHYLSTKAVRTFVLCAGGFNFIRELKSPK